eukprot:4361387-Amphidinium_carterae.1
MFGEGIANQLRVATATAFALLAFWRAVPQGMRLLLRVNRYLVFLDCHCASERHTASTEAASRRTFWNERSWSSTSIAVPIV